MDENEMNNMEEDIIDFEDEDGNVIPFAVIDYVFYNGEEYALLTEVTEEEAEEENQECIVCRVVAETEEDGEETRICKNNAKHEEKRPIAKLDHTHNAGEAVRENEKAADWLRTFP